ncbi:hypothetical protein HQ550_00175 [bacterium]|nr:hypothetical protein [bacterium]
MPNIIRNLFFVFLLVVLMSISKSYGLAQEEVVSLDEKIEYIDEEVEDVSNIFKEQTVKIIADVKEEQKDVGRDNSTVESKDLKKISLDIKGMDIVDVLKLLANRGNLNIITGKNVTGRVSMFLKDVDVWDAFEIIIAANGLAYERKGDIIKVMNARDYELAYGEKYGDRKILSIKKLKYTDAKNISIALNQIKSPLGKVVVDESSNTLIILDVPERVAEMEKIIMETDVYFELETKVFELNYAESDKLKEQLQGVLTKDVGILKVDERTNKIIVTDYPSKIVQIGQIVEAFDEKTMQVLIEAKIIKVTLTDTYRMGIDWKFIASKQLNLTAFNISRSLNTSGAQVVGGSQVPTSTEDFRVIMDMLKIFGDVKTLSTPRITATNGQEAKILVGSKEVYVSNTVVQGDTTQTIAENVNFVDVGVKLYVTPIISKDGFILMKIRPEVSSANREFTKQDGTVIPIVETTEAESSVLVKDGVTIVMGGLMKNERTYNKYKLPLLGEIPFLGAFFRRTEDTITKTELVIFLTPHIISGSESMLGTDKQRTSYKQEE